MTTKRKLNVYKQARPIPTGERYSVHVGTRVASDEWHKANLVLVGVVDTWEQAKALCPAPIVETAKAEATHV